MLIKKPSDILSSEITPESIYIARRDFMRGAITTGILAAGVSSADLFADPAT